MKKNPLFAGAVAKHESLVGAFEKYAVATVPPRIPSFIETYHLTNLTLVFTALVILFSYFVQFHRFWLLSISALIIVQYFTDLLDGALGRYRSTGLVKWGFLMDHLFDYLFVVSQLFGMVLYLPASLHGYIILIIITWGGVMINSFLYFGATNHFRISYTKFGPTEFRIAAVLFYVIGYVFGVSVFTYILPVVTFVSLLIMIAVIFDSHRNLWAIDMAVKNNTEKAQKTGKNP